MELEMYMEAFAEHGSIPKKKFRPAQSAEKPDLAELIKMQQYQNLYNRGGSDDAESPDSEDQSFDHMLQHRREEIEAYENYTRQSMLEYEQDFSEYKKLSDLEKIILEKF